MENSSFILPNGSSVQEFQSMILDFYRQEGRSFPWRETHDPYEILVSELMLQQTQTERVVPKYQNWLQEFPTAQALAQAPFSQVLAAWSGLGYNRRAGYLQEAVGYVWFFGFVMVCCLVTVLVTLMLKVDPEYGKK